MKRAPGPVAHHRSRRIAAASVALVTAVALTGCGTSSDNEQPGDSLVSISAADEDGFYGTLVDPALQIASVTLNDTDGNPVRLDRLPKNEATAVFFGFTHCPDVCPTAMADLSSARMSLPPALAERVTVYFVTVDPERDTRSVLRTWLDRFGTGIIGLRGPTQLVNKVERSLYAVESGPAAKATPRAETSPHQHPPAEQPQQGPPPEGGGYAVNHSGTVHVFGPDGEMLLYTGGTTASQYAADLTRLLEDSQ